MRITASYPLPREHTALTSDLACSAEVAAAVVAAVEVAAAVPAEGINRGAVAVEVVAIAVVAAVRGRRKRRTRRWGNCGQVGSMLETLIRARV